MNVLNHAFDPRICPDTMNRRRRSSTQVGYRDAICVRQPRTISRFQDWVSWVSTDYTYSIIPAAGSALTMRQPFANHPQSDMVLGLFQPY